jgi:tetrapyrrole methylase family protein / MazG family protein
VGNTVPDITIVGLGPGPKESRTLEAERALESASQVFVRSHDGVCLADLLEGDNVVNVGPLRQPNAEPGGRWAGAARAVCDAAASGPVALAIPGHPRFGEGLVIETLREARARGLTTAVIDGISVVDLVAAALDVDPVLSGLQLVNARVALDLVQYEPFESGSFPITPLHPVLLTHVYDQAICAALGRVFGRLYPADHEIIVVERAGSDAERIESRTVGDLPMFEGGPLVALWIPPIDPLEDGADPRAMHHIVARLRRPEGCPWDRKQTNATLRDALVNEVYEVVDAIDAGDMANLAEELGDLYLLILMHAQIAYEAGAFSIEDVYRGITSKIVRRHPHVFGEDAAHAAEDVVGIWNQVKAAEKAAGTKGGRKDVDGEPFSMPALDRAAKILATHPLEPDAGASPLLRAVADLVGQGKDPNRVLIAELRDHFNRNS